MERTMGLNYHRYMRGWCVWLKIGWVGLSFLSAVQSLTLDVPGGGDSCVIIAATRGKIINGNYEVLGHPVKNVMVILRRKAHDRLLYRKQGIREHYFRAEATEDGDYEMCFLNGATHAMDKLNNQEVAKYERLTGLAELRNERKKEQDADKKSDSESYLDDDTLGNQAEPAGQGAYSLSDDMMWDDYESSFITIGFGLRLGEDGEDPGAKSGVEAKDIEMAKFLTKEANNLLQALFSFNDHESYMRGREEWHSEQVKQTNRRLMWCTLLEAAVLVWVSWTQLSYIRRFFETKRAL